MSFAKTDCRVLAFLLVVLLAGCASVEKERRFDAFAGQEARQWPMWPSAPAEPKFVYVGELLGEQNFPAMESERSGLQAAFAWLVGLGREAHRPNILQRPQGVAVDGMGRVLVSDVSRNALLVFDIPQARLLVWQRATPRSSFVAPIGIAQGQGNTLLVADTELGLVAHLSPDGEPLEPLGEGILQRPTGVTRDPRSGRIFVADTRADDVKVFDDNGRLLFTIGHPGDAEDRTALNSPTYLAWSKDRLYVSDTLNARIQIYDGEGNHLGQVGSRGLYVGNLTRPKGVAVDSEGHLYVAESYYDHLLIYDGQGRLLLPIGGAGSGPGRFFLPAGLWIDDRDRLYVADMYNGRVQVLQYLGEGS